MKSPNHVARWFAAGVSVLALTGAGTVAATTEPPDDTAMASDDTSIGTDDTSMSGGSEPAMGAGPSDCPAITEESEGSEAPATSGAAEGTEAASDTGATDTGATEGTTATESVPMDTGMTGDTMVDVSAAPMTGPEVQIVETDEYGPILVDGACFTLYAFTQDSGGVSSCVDDCAVEWPPVFLAPDAAPALADELDPTLFSVAEHPDGPMLMVGDWPLYYFAGDMAPGEMNGQGIGGVWWVVAPDGTLIESEEGGEGSEPAGTEPMDTSTETTGG